jgi:hypothetical protein
MIGNLYAGWMWLWSKEVVFNNQYYWLIDCLRLHIPLKNFSLIWRRHRTAKLRPMLSAQCLWAGRVLYRATSAVTQDLRYYGIIRRTAPFNRLLRFARGWGGHILTRILTGIPVCFFFLGTKKVYLTINVIYTNIFFTRRKKLYFMTNMIDINIIFTGRHVYLGFLFWSAEENLPMRSFRLVYLSHNIDLELWHLILNTTKSKVSVAIYDENFK